MNEDEERFKIITLTKYKDQYDDAKKQSAKNAIGLAAGALAVVAGIMTNSFPVVILSGAATAKFAGGLVHKLSELSGVNKKAQRELGVDLRDVYADEEEDYEDEDELEEENEKGGMGR